MDSPYRSDRTPLQERREALRSALEDSARRLEGLADEAKRHEEIARELRGVDTQLRKDDSRRRLPQLQDVHVAAPCPADWDDMVGDDTTRFCGSCAKSVYNLSAMTEHEAETFLRSTFGAHACVRFYRRADGTLLTRDCAVGVSRRRRKKLAIAVAAVGASAAAALHLMPEQALRASPGVTLGERTQTAQERDERAGEERAGIRSDERGGVRVVQGRVAPHSAGARAPRPRSRAIIGCPVGDPLCRD